MESSNKKVIENISSSRQDLFLAEQKVASYILENPNEVILLNVSELAEKSGTSEATVVRTCKHLGYDGYYQMRLLLSRDLGKNEKLEDEQNEWSSSQKYFSYEANRVKDLAKTISFEQLLSVARILLNTRIAHIVAVGNTVPVAMDLGFRLERAGISCTYSAQSEYYYNHISLGNQQDTVIAITRSGSSKPVIRAVELARQKKMRTIIITGEMNKMLVKDADCVLLIRDRSEQSTIRRPDSHLMEYAISDAILYVLVNVQRTNAKSEDKDDERDQIGILLSEFKM